MKYPFLDRSQLSSIRTRRGPWPARAGQYRQIQSEPRSESERHYRNVHKISFSRSGSTLFHSYPPPTLARMCGPILSDPICTSSRRKGGTYRPIGAFHREKNGDSCIRVYKNDAGKEPIQIFTSTILVYSYAQHDQRLVIALHSTITKRSSCWAAESRTGDLPVIRGEA